MRLIVRHLTSYRYASPISYAIQTLRLAPRPYDGLAIHRWAVTGETRRELPSFIDGYGNITHSHTVTKPHTSASVLVEGEVLTTDTKGIVRGAEEPLPPAFFLRPTALAAADAAIEALAHEAAKAATTLDRLYALLNGVRDRIDYRTGMTDPATTAAEALAQGVGVCQDHAHVFIAAAKVMGVPARYVGGYLWTGDESQDYEASHAWAEAFVEDLGWVGFDASNRTCPTEAYIRASVGLDYWSAAPVRGLRRGVAEETLAVSVKVMQGTEQ
jgi:transglutaminase-like putative cysteine protease